MSNPHVEDRLHELVHGLLEPSERAAMEGHLEDCAHCAGRLRGLREAYARIALSAPPVAPPAPLRARLLDTIHRLERFAAFAPRLGALIDVSANDARRALHALSEPERWPLQPLPGMRAQLLTPGPGPVNMTAILACFAPTAIVPHHHHPVDEWILVFQGAFETDDKHILRAGDELHSPPGSSHAVVRFLGGVECLCAIVTAEGASVEVPRPAPVADSLSGVAR